MAKKKKTSKKKTLRRRKSWSNRRPWVRKAHPIRAYFWDAVGPDYTYDYIWFPVASGRRGRGNLWQLTKAEKRDRGTLLGYEISLQQAKQIVAEKQVGKKK